MANWVKIFEQKLLEKHGPGCTTLKQLATAIGKDVKENITVDAIFNGHRRHQERCKLKSSLTDYLGKEERQEEKLPKLKPEDIRFQPTEEFWEKVNSSKKFIITSAMNNCPVDEDFWKAIKQYARHSNAAIIVVPSRYRNPSTPEETIKSYGETLWDDKVIPYMTDEVVRLHEHLWVMAHVRVGATATYPLSGLEALSGGVSCVFGHAQLAMKMVPTPQNKLPKVMYSTGSCTEPHYSDTRAGVKGKFHHSMGAVVVELDGPRFHIRAVLKDKDAGFYDLDKYYSPRGVKKSPGILGLVTGDEHAMFADKKCKQATYLAKDSIVNVLKPEKIVRHDVFDGYSISHHNRKDPMVQYAKHKAGIHSLEKELQLTIDHINDTTPKWAENFIVPSNHHDHLTRWLKEVHAPSQEPWNVDVYLELWTAMAKTAEYKENGVSHADPFELWSLPRLTTPTRFLKDGDDECIAGILIELHGHKGTNGSRGSIVQFSRFGVKTICGHSHVPGIRYGAYQVGTSSFLTLDYNRGGASSWAHCHCVIYPNGKRQLIFVIDGKWRA